MLITENCELPQNVLTRRKIEIGHPVRLWFRYRWNFERNARGMARYRRPLGYPGAAIGLQRKQQVV
jgi:hypothetical protein